MLVQVMKSVPVWVWPVFVALLVAGVALSRDRPVPRRLVRLVPAVMAGLSFAGMASLFGLGVGPVAAWIGGAMVAAGLAELMIHGPGGVTYDAAADRFGVPGSFVPLALMMGIFWTRFAIGVATGLDPSLAANQYFVWAAGASLGLWSGLFIARARRILRHGRGSAEGA
jgi:hypothetical protein